MSAANLLGKTGKTNGGKLDQTKCLFAVGVTQAMVAGVTPAVTVPYASPPFLEYIAPVNGVLPAAGAGTAPTIVWTNSGLVNAAFTINSTSAAGTAQWSYMIWESANGV